MKRCGRFRANLARRDGLLAVVIVLCGCAPRNGGVDGQARGPAIRFEEVSARAGLSFNRVNGAFGKRWMPETMGGGGAFLDYDNDGWLDILLVNGDWWPGHSLPGRRPTLALYRNNRNGTFTDVTDQAGLNVSLQGMGVAVGDYDNDGREDVYVTGVGESRLFHNEGKGRFTDATRRAGVGDEGHWSTSAAWVDYDGDGRLDLFVCHYIRWSPRTDIFCGTTEKAYCRPQSYPGDSCRLFHNEGDGRFSDVSRKSGIWNENSKALGVCVCDFNHDGLPDLLVTNDTEPNFAFRNRGNGTFTDAGAEFGVAVDDNGKARAGMGIDTADYRGNGGTGIAIGNFAFEGLAFYDAEPGASTANMDKRAGLFEPSYPYVTFGVFFSDVDNDGWPDLFITNGHIQDTITHANTGQTYKQPSLLFQNQGDGTFRDISRAAGEAVTEPVVGRGACRGDYDNDGLEDILVVQNTGAARLLHNQSRGAGHWLNVRLVGTKSPRSGYGARVRVETAGRIQTATCRSGSSYLCASDPRLHFGLGSSTQADRVTVRWPAGTEQSCTAVAADRTLTLTEGRQEKP